MAFDISQPPLRVTDDPAAVDHDFVYRLLSTSYWAGNRPREVIEAAWRKSPAEADPLSPPAGENSST